MKLFNKNIGGPNMETIALKTSTSYNVLPKLRKIMNDSWILKKVMVDYDTISLPDERNIKSYPVTLIFEESGREFAVKILSLSVGYGGSGPSNFSKLLEYFGISYCEDDIFTKKCKGKDNYIRLTYVK